MNIVTIRNIDTSVPSGWDELSTRNLMFLAERFPFVPSRGFVWDFFLHCLNLPKRPKMALAFVRNIILSKSLNRKSGDMLRRYCDDKIQLDDDDLFEFDQFEQQLLLAIEALDNFKWLFDEYHIEKCLLPVITHRFRKWYGPDWLLSNVTGDEFDKADMFFIRFLNDKKPEDLHRLIACIWRPKAKSPGLDDIREPFSEFRIENNALCIARWPMKLQIAAFICYTGMRNAFVRLPDAQAVFSKQIKEKSQSQAPEASAKAVPEPQWGQILLRLADNGALGTLQEVKRSYIHDIISKLAQIKQDAAHVPG